MAKKLTAPFLSKISTKTNIGLFADIMDNVARHAIHISPWAQYDVTNVRTDFAIARCTNALILKYYVTEPFSSPKYSNSNDPVYKDSCVEFFIEFNDGAGYYNFEFNNMGTCLMGFGKGRERQLIQSSFINQIGYHNSFKNILGTELISWELTVNIPFPVFCFHQPDCSQNLYCRGNFFKCGDELPEPHYLVWNDIRSATPDFHLPEFFGSLEFPAVRHSWF